MNNAYDAFGVHFDEAIDALAKKEPVPSRRWDELTGSQRHTAFAIAGAVKVDLVTEVHGLLMDALKNGKTLADFRREFYPLMKRYGWKIRGSLGWRTRLIFNQTMRSSRMAGKWHQIQANKQTRPFLAYSVIDDERLRDAHREWRDVVLPVDHPFWHTHYPPNGWGCRCTVKSMSQRDLDRRGLVVTEAPEIVRTERLNTRTGEVLGNVPQGIDVGWDYNVGMGNIGAEQAMSDKLTSAPKAVANEMMASNTAFAESLAPAWAMFIRSQKTDNKRPFQTVGILTSTQLSALNTDQNEAFAPLVTIDNSSLSGVLSDKSLSKSLPRLFSQALALVQNKLTGERILVVGTERRLRALTIESENDSALTSIKNASPIKKSVLKSADFEILWGDI